MLNFFQRTRLLFAGEQARREHERWLDLAVRKPRHTYPRIPVRKVRDGGFSAITAKPEGRRWADDWWEGAFHRVDTHTNDNPR